MIINSEDISRIAVITKEKHISYKELFQNIAQYSQFFRDKGYRKVAIFSENR